MPKDIAFTRLTDIALTDLLAHMSDPRLRIHMPLLTDKPWQGEDAVHFVEMKESYWRKDGLGHWAFCCDGEYAGWGGFQKEGEQWDYGLMLRPDFFGLGETITNQAFAFAKQHTEMKQVRLLLPPSRKHVRGLQRIGACFDKPRQYEGHWFHQYIVNL